MSKIKQKSKNRKLLIILIIILANAIPIGLVVWFSSIIPYTIAVIRCGHTPIIGQFGLFGTADYYRPGDSGSIGIGGEYFCNERQAIDAGFSNDFKDSLSARNMSSEATESEEAVKFSSQKIPFTAYTPSYLPKDYTRTKIEINTIVQKEVFQLFKNGKNEYFQLRQGVGTSKSDYGACGSVSKCEEIGKDDKGRAVFKATSDNFDNVYFWGIDLDNTYVTMSGYPPLNDINQIFSSLEPIE